MSVFGIYDRGGLDVVVGVSLAAGVRDVAVASRGVGRQVVRVLERHGLEADAVRALDTDDVVLDAVTCLRLGQQLRRCRQLVSGLDYVGLSWGTGGVVVGAGEEVLVTGGVSVRGEVLGGGVVLRVGGVEYLVGAPVDVEVPVGEVFEQGVVRVEQVSGVAVVSEFVEQLGGIARGSAEQGKGMKVSVVGS